MYHGKWSKVYEKVILLFSGLQYTTIQGLRIVKKIWE